jgi:hypothetical protein
VQIRWRPFGIAALISLITMPLTAIWFMLLGGLGLGVLAFLAAFSDDRRGLDTPISATLGLLVGPFVYLALAVLTG